MILLLLVLIIFSEITAGAEIDLYNIFMVYFLLLIIKLFLYNLKFKFVRLKEKKITFQTNLSSIRSPTTISFPTP